MVRTRKPGSRRTLVGLVHRRRPLPYATHADWIASYDRKIDHAILIFPSLVSHSGSMGGVKICRQKSRIFGEFIQGLGISRARVLVYS